MYLELVNITGCSRFGQVPLSNLLICRIPLWPSHQRLSPSLMSLLMTADSSTIYIPDVLSSRQPPSLSNMLVLLGKGKTAAFFWICHAPLLSLERTARNQMAWWNRNTITRPPVEKELEVIKFQHSIRWMGSYGILLDREVLISYILINHGLWCFGILIDVQYIQWDMKQALDW